MSGRHSTRIASRQPGGGGTGRSGRGRGIAVVAVLLVLAGAAAAVAVVLQSDSGKPPAGATGSPLCQSRLPLQVVTSPEIQAATQQVADVWAGTRPSVNGACVTVRVDEQDASSAAETIGVSPENTLWIPDSRVWVGQLQVMHPAVDRALTVSGSVGTSPLVVATSPAKAASLAPIAKSGWAGFLTGSSVVAVPDPLNTSEGALSTLAVQAAVGTSPNASALLVGAFGRLAPEAIPDTATGFGALQSQPTSAPAFVASEQDVVLANRGKQAPMVSAVYPSGPTPVLDFPVVRISLPDADASLVAAQKMFVAQLSTPAAHQAFAGAGLRADPSLPLASGEGNQGASQLPVKAASAPAPSQLTAAARLWVAAVKPSNLLAAIDVSGSMAEDSGNGRSKIALAAGAAQTAVSIVPASWTIGLWSFSIGDPPATDWAERVPLSLVGGARGKLIAQAGSLPGQVGGNTGLYDTAWAAFQNVTRNYNPADVNIVALLTDGANVDPSGISLPTLIGRLRASYEKERPVRIVTIGIGAKADSAALKQISDATHGQSYIVLDPADIRNVLLDAIVANN
jgi:Ca-activated chloride channel family protein